MGNAPSLRLSLALVKEAYAFRLFFMSSSILPVAVGGLLLWFPVWALRQPNSRLAGFDQRGWPKGRHAALAFLDTLRASVGAWLVAGNLAPLVTFRGLTAWKVEIVLALIVAVGLVIQTLAWRDEDHAFAPVTYVLGVVAALVHPVLIGLVIPLALGASLAVRAWSAGFLATGLGMAVLCIVVKAQDFHRAFLLGPVLCLPVLISVMAGRHLGWPKK